MSLCWFVNGRATGLEWNFPLPCGSIIIMLLLVVVLCRYVDVKGAVAVIAKWLRQWSFNSFLFFQFFVQY